VAGVPPIRCRTPTLKFSGGRRQSAGMIGWASLSWG
jgi:hypothetical protein